MVIENTRIPTYSECLNLVESNEAFVKKTDLVLHEQIPVVSFGYRLASYGDFTCTNFARNMRGITFREDTEELLALPYFKFFNYNENPFVEANQVDSWNINKIRDKLDGSLVYYYMIDDGLLAKTKMSCLSEMSFDSLTGLSINRSNHMIELIESGYTPMTEYTSPNNHIVVPYTDTKTTMLDLRNMRTGEIVNYNDNVLSSPNEYYKSEFSSTHELLSFCETYDKIDREGFVITFDNGEMTKIKTAKYRALHRLKDGLTESNVAELTLMESLDDMLFQFNQDPTALNFINNISECVRLAWNSICTESENFYNENIKLTRKDYALKALNEFSKESVQFAYAMNLYLGKSDMSKIKQSFLQREMWKNNN